MSQTSYSDNPAPAFAGMRADTGFGDVITAIAATRQLEQIVVDAATNAGVYEAVINGTPYEFTADGSATVTEIRDGLKALIDAGSEPVSTESVSTDTLLIESTDHDLGFTMAIGGANVADLTLTQLVAQEAAIAFGAVVVEDERVAADAATGKSEGCRLPRLVADITGRKVLGVALADTSKVTRDATPQAGYSAGEAVPVLTKGRIWMAVEDVAAVAKGGLVYVRHVATGSEVLGAIRAADDGTDTDPIPNAAATFTGQKNTALGLAVVQWNLS